MEPCLSDEKLSDSLLIKPAFATSKCLDGNLVDKCVGDGGCTIGRALMKLVIKGTPMPTPTCLWSWLTLDGSSRRVSPNLYSDNTSAFTSSKFNSVLNEYYFPSAFCASSTKLLDMMGKPRLTFAFFYVVRSPVFKKIPQKKPTPALTSAMTLQWNRKSQHQHITWFYYSKQVSCLCLYCFSLLTWHKWDFQMLTKVIKKQFTSSLFLCISFMTLRKWLWF